ncbi:MAG: TIM-barrel domain-containing protein [Chitinispirillaceae bacterium]
MNKLRKVLRKRAGSKFFSLTLISTALFAAHVAGYSVTGIDYMLEDGVIFNMSDSSKMKVQVCTDKIIRIVYTKQATIPKADQNYIVVKGTWDPARWTINLSGTAYSVQTSTVRADIAIATGLVSFYSGGALILQESAAKTLTPVTIGNQAAYSGTIDFNSPSNEGIYGFGQFQNGYFNQRPELISSSYELVQHNQTDCSPVFLSTRGFGILWINYSRMTVPSPLHLTCDWATNDAIDYYFMYGPEFDTIIASYRTITGSAPLWPKWAYGFWQCKNRYQSQYEIMNTVETYRSKNYPIDNIVQDWQYYAQGMNGCACFDPTRYPDPKGMIDSLHNPLHCHFTISVWPSFAVNTDNGNWQFMVNRGYLLSTSDYLGQTYDAFNDSGAHYYWQFIDTGLVSKGADAFWPDATEPESYSGVGWANCNTAQGPAAKVLNIFPLLHSKNLYEGFRRSTGGKKRVCNLTRSYYAGAQHLGAAYWTGDVQTDLTTYCIQIPAGLNICATGLPYFCTDIGGFTGETNPTVLLRWFQWGAFNPVFRIHGTRSTELWNQPQAANEQILVNYSRLRYRLFPYVYSVAWKVTSEGYTIMRGLPFDFRTDANVRDITDQFMFGPAMLICPVTSTLDPSRKVYLPAVKWYDFWTGDSINGGQTITALTPPEIMPIYVRAGSILPMGPEITYADTTPDPIELRVYTGADGSFTLYEDEGDGYNYEQGVYATTPITWNEASQNLSIGPTKGSFPGMLTSRTFNVVWVSPNHGTGESVTTTIDKSITYVTGHPNPIVLNKTTGEIGVINSAALIKGAWFNARVIGRKYIVRVTGNRPWTISVTDLKGRVIAVKNDVRTGSSCVVAERLAPGVYCAQFTYDKAMTWRKTITVQ